MKKTLDLLTTNPVIAAVRQMKDLEIALHSSTKVIFLMGGSLLEIGPITQKVQALGKHIFIHVELIKGLGKDKEAIHYIATSVKPEGIVSTKPQLIKAAASYRISTVLQVFMIDSQAFDSGLKSISSVNPDAVEIMPGLMPRVAAQVKSHLDTPVITAGLIKLPQEVEMMVHSGCHGVAVSEKELWDFVPN